MVFFFTRWTERCYDSAKWILAAFIVLMSIMIAGLSLMKVDMSVDARLRKTDPVRVNFEQFRQRFGRDDAIVISVPLENDFDREFLTTLRQLHSELEAQVPFVKKITSVANARYVHGVDDELVIEHLLEGWPQLRWQAGELKTYLMDQPSYRNKLISADGKSTAIIVELEAMQPSVSAGKGTQPQFLSDANSDKAVNTIREIVKSHPALHIAITGSPVVREALNRRILQGSAITTGIGLACMISMMLLFFRRTSGVVLPIIIIYSAIIVALGIMALVGAPFTLTTSAIVPIIIAVSIGDSVHVLALFYANYEVSGDKRQAIIDAVSHASIPVLFTSLTTAAGFLSFLSSSLADLKDLGIYTAIAVACSWFFTLVLIPACVAVFSIKRHTKGKLILQSAEDFTLACGRLACRYPRSISFFSTVACLVGIVFAANNLHFSDDIMANFPNTEIAKQDLYRIDGAYKGSGQLEVVIDSGSNEGIYQPEFLAKLNQLSERLSNRSLAGIPLANSYSVLNILKETHRALNGNQASFYALPASRELVAQELLLFDISEHAELLRVTDENFRYARLSLKMAYADSVLYQDLLRAIDGEIHQVFGPQQPAVVTGLSAVSAFVIPMAMKSTFKSYIWSFIGVTVCMIIAFRNWRIGLLSMLPNILPIVLVLDIMVLMGWPLDQTTLVIGAIAIGVVVDNTIHFVHNYLHHVHHHGIARKAVMQSLDGCGSALFITSTIFAMVSLSNALSSMTSIIVFGVCMGLVTFFALLADLIIMPALLVVMQDTKMAVIKISEMERVISEPGKQ